MGKPKWSGLLMFTFFALLIHYFLAIKENVLPSTVKEPEALFIVSSRGFLASNCQYG